MIPVYSDDHTKQKVLSKHKIQLLVVYIVTTSIKRIIVSHILI
jgi:hypothetical protein